MKKFKQSFVKFDVLPSEIILYKILPFYCHTEKAIDAYKETNCLRFYGRVVKFNREKIVKLFDHLVIESKNMDINNLNFSVSFPKSLKSCKFVLDSVDICELPKFLQMGRLNKRTNYDKFMYERRFMGDLFCRFFISDFPDPDDKKIKYKTKEFSKRRKTPKINKDKDKNKDKNVARIHEDGKDITNVDIKIKDLYKRVKLLRHRPLLCVKIGVGDKTELCGINLLLLLKWESKIKFYDSSFFYGDGTLTYC